MRIIVTGGAGFIGSHIVDCLEKEGHDVTVVDDLSNGKRENNSKNTKFHRISITDLNALNACFLEIKPEIVFHLAAHINVRNSLKLPAHDAEVNIIGSLNVLECCRLHSVKKIIFSSTGGAIYGETNNIPTTESESPHPISHYGVAKFSIENYIYLYKAVYGLEYVILRYANVFGPRQDPIGEAGVVSIFINAILDGKDCRINGEGKQTRDYVFVGDVVAANMAAFHETPKSKIFNIGTGKETSVIELYQQIEKEVLAKTSKKTGYFHGPVVQGEVMRSCLDASLAKKELIWTPKIKLQEGIGKTVDFFMKKH